MSSTYTVYSEWGFDTLAWAKAVVRIPNGKAVYIAVNEATEDFDHGVELATIREILDYDPSLLAGKTLECFADLDAPAEDFELSAEVVDAAKAACAEAEEELRRHAPEVFDTQAAELIELGVQQRTATGKDQGREERYYRITRWEPIWVPERKLSDFYCNDSDLGVDAIAKVRMPCIMWGSEAEIDSDIAAILEDKYQSESA